MGSRVREALEHLSTFMGENGSYYKAFENGNTQYQKDLEVLGELVENYERYGPHRRIPMTNKEAITVLGDSRMAINGNPNVDEDEFDRYAKAIQLAVVALDYQIPWKVERKERFNGHCYYCGRCHKRIEDAGHDYCGYCGTLLDWSEAK